MYTYIYIYNTMLYMKYIICCRTSCYFIVRIARIRRRRFVPRVGLPRNLFLIGSLMAALRFSKGRVRKDPTLGLGTGCIS